MGIGNQPGEVSNTCGWTTEVKDTPQLAFERFFLFLRHKVNLFLSSHNVFLSPSTTFRTFVFFSLEESFRNQKKKSDYKICFVFQKRKIK